MPRVGIGARDEERDMMEIFGTKEIFRVFFFSFFVYLKNWIILFLFLGGSGDLLYFANSVLYLKKMSLLYVNYTAVYLVP